MSHWEVICHLTSSGETVPWTCLLCLLEGAAAWPCLCVRGWTCLLTFQIQGVDLLWVLHDREDVPVPMGPAFHHQGDDVGSWWVNWHGCPYPLREHTHYAPSLSPCPRPCQPGLKPMHKWTRADEVNRGLYRQCCQYGQQPSHTGACLWEGGRQHCRPGASRSAFPAPTLATSHPRSLV